MAKQLSLNNIQTGQAIEAAHVSQSIKALTGAEAYDISISGSLDVTGQLGIDGDLNINPSQSSNGTSVLTIDNSGKVFKTGSYGGGGGTGTGFPFSGSAEITGSLLISQSGLIVTGSTQLYGSGSTIFQVQGSRGVLFSIDDDESDNKLFSVNNITGIPVLEVYQDNTVKLGKNNGYGIIITGSGLSSPDLNANIIITGSIYQTGSNVVFSSNLTSSGNIEINKGILSIKNNGNQSVARFYCEDNNQHYTELKAQPHALYSGNPITLLPAYNFDFSSPDFRANITASGNISASGYISASNLHLSESITATNIYATNLIVTNITSSVITSSTVFTSGSNQIGDELSDIQTLIGSTIITGSLTVSGSVINNLTSSNAISSSYSLTASYVENAQSASYVLNAVSASFASTASYVLNAVSASFASTALTANSSSQATSASYALTASYVETAQTASYVENAQTASYVETAQTASYVTTAQTASYVLASNIDQPFTNITASVNISASGDIISKTGSFIVAGIGTSSPATELEARGTSRFSADGFGRVEIIPTAGNDGTAVIKQSTGSPRNGGNLKIQVNSLNGDGGNLFFATNGDNTRMTIESTGDVGIGTTTPGEKLEVIGNISASGLLFANLTETDTSDLKTVVYDTTTGQFFRTGSYGGGGAGFPFSGSADITGSLLVSGSFVNFTDAPLTASIISASSGITGSLLGTASTASYVETAQTASYVTLAQTASYVETAQTASFVTLAQTASFVTTAQTASYVLNAVSSSYALTASHALNVSTPTLQEVTTAGNQITNQIQIKNNSFVISKDGGGNKAWLGTLNSNEDGFLALYTGSGVNIYLRPGTSYINSNLHLGGSGNITDQLQVTGDALITNVLTLGTNLNDFDTTLIVTGSAITTGNLITNTISASGNLYANVQEDEFNIGLKVIVYNPTTGKFFRTGSYNSGDGAGFPFSGSAKITGSLLVSQSFVDFTNAPLTASIISASNHISSSNLILGTGSFSSPSIGFNTANAGIFYNSNANTVAITDGLATRAEISNYILFRTYLSMNNNYIQNISYLSGSALELRSKNPITASATISSSGNLFADVTDNSDTSFKTVMYDPTTGQFFRTGSYAPAPSSVATSSFALTASYIEASNIDQPFTDITASGNISASGTIDGLSGSFKSLFVTGSLDVFVNLPVTTEPKFRVGRDSLQYIGIGVGDYDNIIVAKQDPDSGGHGNQNFILNRDFDGGGYQ